MVVSDGGGTIVPPPGGTACGSGHVPHLTPLDVGGGVDVCGGTVQVMPAGAQDSSTDT